MNAFGTAVTVRLTLTLISLPNVTGEAPASCVYMCLYSVRVGVRAEIHGPPGLYST